MRQEPLHSTTVHLSSLFHFIKAQCHQYWVLLLWAHVPLCLVLPIVSGLLHFSDCNNCSNSVTLLLLGAAVILIIALLTLRASLHLFPFNRHFCQRLNSTTAFTSSGNLVWSDWRLHRIGWLLHIKVLKYIHAYQDMMGLTTQKQLTWLTMKVSECKQQGQQNYWFDYYIMSLGMLDIGGPCRTMIWRNLS